MSSLSTLFATNANWAKNVTVAQPSFFTTLNEAQHPRILWVGCGDSRVPESVLLDMMPGQVFTHRNIANQFQLDDNNANAVLEYGVLHLNITDVVIVGHTNCGGAKAAHAAGSLPAESTDDGSAEDFGEDSDDKESSCKKKGGCGNKHKHKHDEDRDDKDYHHYHHHVHHHHNDKRSEGAADSALNQFLGPLIELKREIGINATLDDLIVANVNRSVFNVANSATFKAAWKANMTVSVHGWLYNLSTGLLSDLDMSIHNRA